MPPTIVPASITVAREPDQRGQKRPTELIAKANAEIDRLRGIAKQKGDKLTPEDALPTYDAVHSLVMAATAGKDEGLLDLARNVKAKYDSIVRNTPADKPLPFTQHPAASPEPISKEEGSRVVIAQRGCDADLNPQRIQEARTRSRRSRNGLRCHGHPAVNGFDHGDQLWCFDLGNGTRAEGAKDVGSTTCAGPLPTLDAVFWPSGAHRQRADRSDGLCIIELSETPKAETAVLGRIGAEPLWKRSAEGYERTAHAVARIACR